MHRIVWWLIAAGGAGLFGIIAYNAMRKLDPPMARQEPNAEMAAPAVKPLSPEPEIRHPVPLSLPEKPLPALDTSDSTVKNALLEWPGGQQLIETLVLDGLVRRVVATIDSLPSAKVSPRLLPLRRVSGTFSVSGEEGNLVIAAENAVRYGNYLKIAEAIDSRRLAAFYFHYYPLFQQAYRDLGYPGGHFNDRLIAVIDHLLEAPELRAPVRLARPKVLYLYADPALESRSAGQKILMRMGAENAVRIKSRLREIRAVLAAPPEPQNPGK